MNKEEDFDFERFKQEAMEGLYAGKKFGGTDGVAAPLLKHLLESMLDGELAHHLQEDKASGYSNRRNGKSKKTVRSLSGGSFELETVYPFVFLDCMHYKVRHNGTVETRAIYNILGIRIDGRKDLIGLYLSENEGAKFWLSVLTDLKQRGVQDILIACIRSPPAFIMSPKGTRNR